MGMTSLLLWDAQKQLVVVVVIDMRETFGGNVHVQQKIVSVLKEVDGMLWSS
jgi:hypothetical protein